MPGSSLLSHGETPHYRPLSFTLILRCLLSAASVTYECMLLRILPCRLVSGQNPADDRYFSVSEKQKTPASQLGFFLFDAWQFPTLAWGDPTLPSALRRFTSEFGMGSGGTTALQPPGKFFVLRCSSFSLIRRWLRSGCSVTYGCMLLLIPRLSPCLSKKPGTT